MLDERLINATGIFDPQKVNKLVDKLGQPGSQATEVENMAIAGILSTQLLDHFFIRDTVLVSPGEKPANLRIFRD